MSVFRSKLEDILEAEELLFDPTPGFGRYKPFLESAIAHPAKMNTKLLEFLIDKFTRQGDTVLDPMCGSGSTGVVAALRGRHAVQVDIEKKFVDWAEEARRKVEAQATLTPKGRIQNICGDARKLSELLKNVDVVVTSPPYGKAQTGSGIAKKGYQGSKHSPTDLVGKRSYMPDKFESEENISRLPMGEVDVVITSPPFADGFKHNPQDKEKRLQKLIEVEKNAVKKGQKWAMSSKEALERRLQRQDNGYGEKKENIGNLPFQPDAIITSPPYEGSLEGGSRHTKGGIASRDPALAQTGTYATRMSFGVPVGYSASKDNIGNFKKETYLEAMLKVYMEMYKVLKPNGLAIIVIKPFIRQKRVVDLPYHTWLLLKKVGFKLVKLYKLRLKTHSFWRILYHKKYPNVQRIKHEYVLVCASSVGD